MKLSKKLESKSSGGMVKKLVVGVAMLVVGAGAVMSLDLMSINKQSLASASTLNPVITSTVPKSAASKSQSVPLKSILYMQTLNKTIAKSLGLEGQFAPIQAITTSVNCNNQGDSITTAYFDIDHTTLKESIRDIARSKGASQTIGGITFSTKLSENAIEAFVEKRVKAIEGVVDKLSNGVYSRLKTNDSVTMKIDKSMHHFNRVAEKGLENALEYGINTLGYKTTLSQKSMDSMVALSGNGLSQYAHVTNDSTNDINVSMK